MGKKVWTGMLRGEALNLRFVATTDVLRLTEILSDPDVARWQGHWDLDRVRREMIDVTDSTVTFAIEVDDQVIGVIQCAEENVPDYRHASIDICVHPASQGQGLGSEAVRTPARHLVDDRGHHRITIDPAAHNQRAIRSYRRVGFRPVGVMRRYERGLDGRLHDGLLMDLLPEDLAQQNGWPKVVDHP